jgi:hypothetical protein
MATNTPIQITDNYDALLSTTLRKYRAKLVDNIFRDLPLLHWLNTKGRKETQDGGYEIIQPIIYGTNDTVKVYGGYDVLDTRAQEGITSARYQWNQMAVSIAISREEERKNSGQSKLLSLLEAKTMQAEKSMQLRLNNLLHGRHGSRSNTYAQAADDTILDSVGGTAYKTARADQGGFNSLDHFVRSHFGMVNGAATTAFAHKVGGIGVSITGSLSGGYDKVSNQAPTAQTNPWWMNYAVPGFTRFNPETGNLGPVQDTAFLAAVGDWNANSNAGLNAGMRHLYNVLSDGGEHPDIGLAGQSVFEAYESSLVPNERFLDTKLGDSGFQNLRFKGMTMVYDPGIVTPIPTTTVTSAAPGTPLYMLNSEYLKWVVDSQTDFYTTPFVRPANQDARVAQILLMAQLTCSNRQKQGVYLVADGNSYA